MSMDDADRERHTYEVAERTCAASSTVRGGDAHVWQYINYALQTVSISSLVAAVVIFVLIQYVRRVHARPHAGAFRTQQETKPTHTLHMHVFIGFLLRFILSFARSVEPFDNMYIVGDLSTGDVTEKVGGDTFSVL
jgi:heme/copper-type cytochrome/quinol oxidase subunit 2